MSRTVLLFGVSLLFLTIASSARSRLEEVDCVADAMAQRAALYSIMKALPLNLPSNWTEIGAGSTIKPAATSWVASIAFRAPSGSATLSITAYRDVIARYFIRVGLNLRADGQFAIRGRTFRAMTTRTGTLYILVGKAVVVTVKGTADRADKALLAARLNSALLSRLDRISTIPSLGASAC